MGPNKQQYHNYKAFLRYKTETRPGLVALYDIWPGNGAGQFLQPQSPHGALDIPRNQYEKFPNQINLFTDITTGNQPSN